MGEEGWEQHQQQQEQEDEGVAGWPWARRWLLQLSRRPLPRSHRRLWHTSRSAPSAEEPASSSSGWRALGARPRLITSPLLLMKQRRAQRLKSVRHADRRRLLLVWSGGQGDAYESLSLRMRK